MEIVDYSILIELRIESKSKLIEARSLEERIFSSIWFFFFYSLIWFESLSPSRLIVCENLSLSLSLPFYKIVEKISMFLILLFQSKTDPIDSYNSQENNH